MATTYKDYYAILGVPRTASAKEVRAAYRKLARTHHPDLNAGDTSAEARFKEINEANEVLGDPEKRRRYDDLGPRWHEYEQWERTGQPGPNPFGAARPQFEFRSDPDAMEFSDFFETFFGRQGGRRRQVARRGEDVVGETTITLEEAFQGATRTVELDTGSGTRRVEVHIPAGIHDGARVRAAGQGSAGRGGGPSGDLYVGIRVRPHRRFTRDGADLRATVAVPLATAIAGGTVAVPTLRGTTVELTVPPATQSGARLRLRALGMPHVRGGGAGDLIAQVDVRLPIPAPDDLREWAGRQPRGLPEVS